LWYELLSHFSQNKKIKLDNWSKNIFGLEQQWEGDSTKWLESRGVAPTSHDGSLGTIGGGNHFAELQMVERVEDEATFAKMGLTKDNLYLLIHSGSRSFGAEILDKHTEQYGIKGVVATCEYAKTYMKQHDHAMCWARCNRALIAHRFLSCLLHSDVITDTPQYSTNNAEELQQSDTQNPINLEKTKKQSSFDHDIEEVLPQDITTDGSVRVLDIWHNCVTKKTFRQGDQTTPLLLHRKGAAPSDKGPVIIPGSRGAFSYLVLPTDNIEKLETSGFSLAHGAGRKWNRSKALEAGKKYKNSNALTTTELGSKVICESKELLYEEMPSAYKEIENIIVDLVDWELIKVIAVFRPLITYKTRVMKYDDRSKGHHKNKEEDIF